MKFLSGLLFVVLGASSSAFAAGEGMNFRFSPLGLIIGSVNGGLDIAVAPEWTVGPTASYWRFNLSSSDSFSEDYKITAWSVGARANWFKNGNFTDGLYVGPSVSYANVELETLDTTGAKVTGEASGLFLTGLVGYGWFWDSFNIMLGGGFSAGLGSTEVKVTDSSGSETKVSSTISGVALEFSLGWTF